jgi:hypothetical protein
MDNVGVAFLSVGAPACGCRLFHLGVRYLKLVWHFDSPLRRLSLVNSPRMPSAGFPMTALGWNAIRPFMANSGNGV